MIRVSTRQCPGLSRATGRGFAFAAALCVKLERMHKKGAVFLYEIKVDACGPQVPPVFHLARRLQFISLAAARVPAFQSLWEVLVREPQPHR
tara:strand:+ start:8857 stop:9132 length:276 start_codon:yes stop_codon:yes gene_type:complete